MGTARHLTAKNSALTGLQLFDIAMKNSSTLLVATNKGIYNLNIASGASSLFVDESAKGAQLPSAAAAAVARDQRQRRARPVALPPVRRRRLPRRDRG